MEALLSDYLKPIWEANLPFTCFKLPNAEYATVYHQKDDKVYFANQLESEGFVMAPFDFKDKIYCIPNYNTEIFEMDPIRVVPKIELEVKFTETERKSFEESIILAKEDIEAKRLRKVVLSHSKKYQTKRNLIELFDELLNLYPETMVYLWHHPKVGTWFGASPERFITCEEGYAHTMALAGTQVRPEYERPKWEQKEIEEQALVAAQIEEDLNQIFSANQISKSQTRDLYVGYLAHLCTNFKFPKERGTLRQLAQRLHPTPAVGGMPKEKAIQFIKENETYNREFYTGFLGPISQEEYQLFVNLRCAQWTADAVILYAGAGITELSDPSLEWKETQKKISSLLTIL